MSMILRCVMMMGLGIALVTNVNGNEVPHLINYQGFLQDDGNPADGSFAVTLRLYNMQTGGTLLFADSNTVAVADGLYSTLIGDDPIYGTMTNIFANSSVWVEVEINGNTLTPRERLVSSAYAIRANPQVSFNVRLDVQQNISGSSIVNFDNEIHDDGNNFTLGNNAKFTAPVDGVYFFQGSVLTGGNSAVMHAHLKVNGNSTQRSRIYSVNPESITISAVLKLFAGQYVQLYVDGFSGTVYTQSFTWFSGYQIY